MRDNSLTNTRRNISQHYDLVTLTKNLWSYCIFLYFASMVSFRLPTIFWRKDGTFEIDCDDNIGQILDPDHFEPINTVVGLPYVLWSDMVVLMGIRVMTCSLHFWMIPWPTPVLFLRWIYLPINIFFLSVLCVTNVLKSILSRLKSNCCLLINLQGPEEPLIDAQMRKINHMIDKV